MKRSLVLHAALVAVLMGATCANANTAAQAGNAAAAKPHGNASPTVLRPGETIVNPFTMEKPTAEQLAREDELRKLAAGPQQAASPAAATTPSQPQAGTRPAQSPDTSADVRKTATSSTPRRIASARPTGRTAAPDLSDWGQPSASQSSAHPPCNCDELADEGLGRPRLVTVYSIEGRHYAVVEMYGSRVPLAHGSISPWGRVHIDDQGRTHFGTPECETAPGMPRCASL